MLVQFGDQRGVGRHGVVFRQNSQVPQALSVKKGLPSIEEELPCVEECRRLRRG
jgi:hypothetical protein